MKTLILFTSDHESTKTIARQLKLNLQGETILADLNEDQVPDPDDYESIIIGASTYSDASEKMLQDYCQTNLEKLIIKELGLFLSCREKGFAAQMQFETIFPAELLEHAKSTVVFDGNFRSNRIQMLSSAEIRTEPEFDLISKFTARMNRVFNPFMFFA